MTLLLIIGVLVACAAVGLIAAAVFRRTPEAEGRLLGRIESYGFIQRRGREAGSAGMRGRVDDFAGKVGSIFERRSGEEGARRIRRDLVAAGLYNITPGKFFGYRALCTAALPLLWLWFAATAGVSGGLAVLTTVVIAALGWVLPGRLLRQRATQRLNDIDYNLPELIDLLVVTVEAGLGFVGSLQMASTRIKGALGQELRLTLQEQNMGLSIQEALINMLARCDTPAMRSFVRSIVQGETLGVSIGQIMRDLAHEMRRRRRAVAEERAQKAPIKILFPLVFLIFPAMFVVLLGPAVFLFLRAFGG
jgi:tight adherence protein C